MKQIKNLQAEMQYDITPNQMKMFLSLAADYNNAVIAEGNLDVNSYVTNGVETTAFEEAQDPVGNYQVNKHSGIDVVGGDLKSPFFLQADGGIDEGSNGKTFSIIGTDLHMKVLHGDAGSVKQRGDFFNPGDTIMPFPKKNNFNTASTGPHFHIEIHNGKNF